MKRRYGECSFSLPEGSRINQPGQASRLQLRRSSGVGRNRMGGGDSDFGSWPEADVSPFGRGCPVKGAVRTFAPKLAAWLPTFLTQSGYLSWPREDK